MMVELSDQGKMSMLAEPRRKQKWTLNPRGKQWSEDSNKFGQKMLEKMGWTSGKGLGANEQGMTEHVRVSYKDDTAGIGFKKENMDKAWTEHQDSFNDFLQELQKSQSGSVPQTEDVKSELSGKSLELKSKQSRARVHYHKFTRGKDVNKYTSKDIANIFGQKDLNIEKNIKDNESNDQESPDPIGAQDNTGGVITINGGNIADYFMRKGQDFPFTARNKSQRESNSESEPEYAGFGFTSENHKKGSQSKSENKEKENSCNYAFENPCLKLNSPENISNPSNGFKSSKKRKVCDNNESGVDSDSKKFKKDIVHNNESQNGFVNDALNLECQANEFCNGKEFEVSRVEFGVANSALDLSDEIEDKKRVTFNDHVEYSTDCVKKKKGKTKLDKFEVENKKSKRKKKPEDNVNNSVSSGFVNEALDIEEVSEEVNDNEINERKSRKSKKRKGSRRSNLETIVETPEEDKEVGEDEIKNKKVKTEDNVPNNSISKDDVSKKAKKKKKKKEKEKAIEVITITESDTNDGEELDAKSEVKSEKEDEKNLSKEKKKKKKKKTELNDVNSEDISENTPEITDDDKKRKAEKSEETETVLKKSKEKKKKEDIIDSIVEVAEAENVIEISDKENTDGICESTQKSKKPKKKKQKESVDESIGDKNSTHNEESITESTQQTTNATSLGTPSRSAIGRPVNFVSSPWSDKAKMSKRLLKSLFHRHAVENFPGSNIHEIKGYGVQR
ncbi:uncharacterized protein LOC143183582 [Calliopsis andreniformis]|uniref:uncharacterized protein LOC143183582 n=1 Tax=Calliopsis andreniformis TaxID=337506 RepID=UPI003FCD4ACC